MSLLLFVPATPTWAKVTDELRMVGEARLKVFFWSIYDSALYTESGRYSGIEPKLTLEINYLRTITSKQLLNRTSKEWQNTMIKQHHLDTWLLELARFLPDVKKGEKLALQVEEDLSSSFYLNDRFLGNIRGSEFTQAFLAIWLSEASSYPSLRAKLIGRN